MSKGASGRIVIEVDPDLKRKLYSALAGDNSTLKDWFLGAAQNYIAEHEQPSLPDISKKNNARATKP
jgi:hypothetical protein